MSGYKGFGSFHSASMEELMTTPADQYEAPPPRAYEERVWATLEAKRSLGAGAKEELFYISKEWTFINHGAFGGAARAVFDVAVGWKAQAETQPLQFIDRDLFPYLARTQRLLAARVNCGPEDLVMTPNVTTALNAVLQSVVGRGRPDGVVLSLDIGYSSLRHMITSVVTGGAGVETGDRWVEARVPLPFTNDEIVAIVEEAVGAHKERLVLAVFDHITSNSAAILPVKALVTACHRHGVPVLIDGAHALGSVPIDIEDIGADFYTSNCHKWFMCPKGAAFMYVHKDHQPSIIPPIISHGAASGFQSRFVWDGARDYSSALAVPTALRLIDSIGEGTMRTYMHSMCQEGAEILKAEWKTETLFPPDMVGSMAMVRLPDTLWKLLLAPEGAAGGCGGGQCVVGGRLVKNGATAAHSKAVQDHLHHCEMIEVPIKVINGRLFTRISAHIYNCPADYRALATAVMKLKKGDSPWPCPRCAAKE